MAVAAAGVILVAAGVGVVAIGLRDRATVEGPLVQAAASPLDRGQPEGSPYAFANLDEADAGQVEVAQEVAPSIVRVDSAAARGSGIVVSDVGVILTSASVVGDRTEVAVGLADGRLMTGTVLGSDPVTGVAVVDIPGAGYTETELTEVPTAEILGEQGLAFGVDELGRLVLGAGDIRHTPEIAEPPDAAAIDGVLVVDTAVDPVARGGPLLDEVGTLVGLSVWTNGAETYAVPAATLRKVVDDIVDLGAVQHTWLGITGVTVFENNWPAGVRVRGIQASGPSEGVLQVDDVVVAVDDQVVSQMSALVAELRHHDPGDVIQVSFRRAGSATALTQPVTLGRRTPAPSTSALSPSSLSSAS